LIGEPGGRYSRRTKTESGAGASLADVFISYKREERGKAKALAEAVVKRGYSVWWDVDLLPGDRFAKEIDAVIGKAKAAVVLWSKASIESDWVIAEATEAKKRKIFLPALIETVEPPLYFRGDHAVDLTTWDGDAESDLLAPLLAAIERRAGPPSEKPAAQASAVAEALAAPNLEAEFWRTVSAAPIQTVGEYEAYLRKFGNNGLFADVARMRIDALKSRTPQEAVHNRLRSTHLIAGIAAATVSVVGFAYQLLKDSGSVDAPAKSGKAPSALAAFTPERFASEQSEALVDEALGAVSIEKLEAASESSAVAATLAGLAHGLGRGGLAVDDVKATKLYRLGCDGGVGEACFRLAANYAFGKGVTPDEEKAAQILQRGCAIGDADSCTDLGYSYEIGRGVPQSDVNAADYYRRACDAGNALGCNNLGYRYQTGKGVAQDEAGAAALYRRACEAGSGLGCGNLGFVLAEGIGLAPSETEAVRYYRLGCDLNDAASCGNLGFMISNGRGSALNDGEAAGFLKRGCEGGHKFACAHYAVALDNSKGVANDPAGAVRYYSVGCEAGFLFACTNLGFMYQGDRGVPVNHAESLRLYRIACDGGESYGCNNLGHMYMTGRGVAPDLTRAISLFERALKLDENNQYAKDNLAIARKGA
jgi:hypothetical protein